MKKITKYIIKTATKKKLRLCCVESVTGGKIASALTSVAGASKVFYSGIVTYDLQSKIDFLEIPKEFFQFCSAYSPKCAELMAENWREKCSADICISTTGKAEEDGQIYFGISTPKKEESVMKIFLGTREEIQHHATEYALELMALLLDDES